MEKTILLKMAGSRGEPKELVIRSGVTVRDIKQQEGIPDNYFLTADPTGAPFGNDEVLYNSIEDGSKIFAVLPMDVGE